jgi:uncharacterized membrane protein
MAQQNQVPQHVRETAQTIEDLRRRTHEGLPKHEMAVQLFTRVFGRPATVAVVSVFIIGWVVANVLLRAHHASFDDNTFSLLALIAQLLSLILVIAILSAENTQAEIAQYRERLMVEMLTIQDRKITEVLNLLKPKSEKGELERPTDLHEAAAALQEAEEQSR